jgi:hypothetical protein
MKNIFSLVPLVAFLIYSCKSSNEPSSNSEGYFPLKVGNKWYYNSVYPDTNSISIIWEVTGQEEINYRLYYRIIEQNTQINLIDTLFYRVNGDTLFRGGKNNEQIIADFSLSLNDTAYWQNDLRVVEKNKDIIRLETPFGADYGYSITFQKGIGITNSVQNGFVYYRMTLIKAELK